MQPKKRDEFCPQGGFLGSKGGKKYISGVWLLLQTIVK